MSAEGETTRTGPVLLFTGDGKGKTTAALGLTLRLAGHGRKVLVVQFAKGDMESGERRALEKLDDLVTLAPLGKGWLDLKAHPRRPEDVRQLRESWHQARRLIGSGDYDAVVLDEIVFVVSAGFLPAEEVLDFLDGKPSDLTVVMTGRGEVPEFVERADYVTVMRNVKHPFDKGAEAAPGIEY